jgi:polar amino acid transport system substrate-binding protein
MDQSRLSGSGLNSSKLTATLMAALVSALLLSACEKTDNRYVRSAADAAHARIGVITGSTPAQLAYERFPEADIQEYGDFADTLGAIKAGHIDVTITAINNAILAARNNPDLEVIEESLRDETTAVAIRKGNTELLDQVNAIIAAIKADGTLDDIDRRWLKRDPGPYEEKDIPAHTEGEVLYVGVNATREPFSFMDQNGRITGHDGELARVIADRLQRPLEFVNVRWDALIPALQSGKIDMVVTGMTANEERRQFVDFSTPYYMNKLVLLVRKPPAAGTVANSGHLQLNSVEDLKTRRLGVLQGSAFDTYAQQNFPDADIRQFIGFADVLLAVETGAVDAAFTDIDALKEAQKLRPEFVAIGEPVFHSDVAAGFRKDSGDLRAAFNAFLAQIQADGTQQDIMRRWTEESSTAMPDIRFTGSEEPLRIGNAILGLPQVAVQDNQLVGLDVEIATRFAQYLGRRPEWSTVDWSALIPSLVSGKTDVIISSMFVTPERKERIDFSEPYYRTANYAFTLRRNLAGQDNGQPPGAAEPESFWAGVARSFHSNIIREDRYLMLLDGLKVTMILSILSSLFGTVLGALICFMRMSKRALLRIPAKIYIAIMRGIPVLVLLMLIFYVIFASVKISPVLVAVIAFGLNFAAYAAEIFRVGIQSIDRGQTEAGISMGFSKVATFRHIILPQTIQRILPVYKGEFISMVKMTSIVGYVAVQDLTKVSDIIRSRTFDAFFPLVMVAVLYFLLAWVLIQALEYLERKTDPVRRRSAKAKA